MEAESAPQTYPRERSRRVARRATFGYLLVFGLWVYLSEFTFPNYLGASTQFLPERLVANLAFMTLSAAALYVGLRLLIEKPWLQAQRPGQLGLPVPKAFTHLLPLGVFTALALGVSVAGYLLFQQFVREVKRERHQELHAVLALKVHEVRAWHQQQTQTLRALMRDHDFDDLVVGWLGDEYAGDVLERLRRRLNAVAGTGEIDSAYLFDEDGTLRFISNPRAKGLGEPVAAAVRAAMQTKEPAQVLLQADDPEANYRPRLGFIQPLDPHHGQLSSPGALLFRVNPAATLLPMLETWPTASRTGVTVLMQESETGLVHLSRQRHALSTAPPRGGAIDAAQSLDQQLLAGKTGPLEGLDDLGQPVMGAGLKLAGTPWYLLTTVDIAEVEEPLASRAFFTGALALAFVFGAGLVVWLWWQRQRAWMTAREVEEIKVAQAASRESEQRFRDLTEMSSDWYWEQDAEFRFTLLSEGLRRVGLHPETYLGKTRWDSPGIDGLRYNDWTAHQRLVEAHLPFDNFEYCRRTNSGELLWQTLSGRPVVDAQGHFTGYRGVGHDITERKRAEEQLRRLNATLEERVQARTRDLEAALAELEAFSYSVSHDLRAPLRAIDGFSAALEQHCGQGLDAEARGYLARTRAAAQRMGVLIDDLLELSRVGRAGISLTTVNLSAIATELARDMAANEPRRRVDWVIEPDLYAEADPRLVHLVLQNLLGNAWKYTSRHETARIEFGRAYNRDQETEFLVRDDGAGFDMAHAKRLFGAFQRLHRQDDFPGTGVGLAIVQRIVTRHGGQVRAEAAVETGATFYFTLPPSTLS
ncbi:MAG: PAS domain S-box protein [Betaproteobacteria bacterium]|nr:PAS domain S-box protein [Betaproteobacteria bacterium]